MTLEITDILAKLLNLCLSKTDFMLKHVLRYMCKLLKLLCFASESFAAFATKHSTFSCYAVWAGRPLYFITFDFQPDVVANNLCS